MTGITMATDHNGNAVITVDLDAFDLSLEQGFASGVTVARLNFLRDGKRVTANVDLFQHELRKNPTLRLTIVNRTRDITQTVQVNPWTPVRDEA